MKKRFVMYTDGAARGNPGPAGIGVVICDESGAVVKEVYRYLGETTNNQAEYSALLAGLEAAVTLKVSELDVRMDSELIVKQLKGEYKVKNEGLKPLFNDARSWIKKFDHFSVMHVPREQNKLADKLANKAIDEAY